MASFRTKTIQSILDPVANQISQLVLLEELASKGNQLPDITPAVDAVNNAANNLGKAAKDTIDRSDDFILKEEMPHIVELVMNSTKNLKESASILKENSKSLIGLSLLTDGARALLNGISKLMFVFDDSEIRRITNNLKSFKNYLMKLEDIKTKMDLLNFGKGFKEILVSLNPQIEKRINDLISKKQYSIIQINLNGINENVLKLMTSSRILVGNYEKYKTVNEKIKKVQIMVNKEIFSQCSRIDIIIAALTTECSDLDAYELMEFSGNCYLNPENIIGHPIKYLNEYTKNKYDLALLWLNDPNKMPETVGHWVIREIIDGAIHVSDYVDKKYSDILKNAASTLGATLEDIARLRLVGMGGSEDERNLSIALREGLLKLSKIMEISSENIDEMNKNIIKKDKSTSDTKGLISKMIMWFNDEKTQYGTNMDETYIQYGKEMVTGFIGSFRRIAGITHNKQLKSEMNDSIDIFEKYFIELYGLQKESKFSDERYRVALKHTIDYLNKFTSMIQLAFSILSRKPIVLKKNLENSLNDNKNVEFQNFCQKFSTFNNDLNVFTNILNIFGDTDKYLQLEIKNKIGHILNEGKSLESVANIAIENNDSLSKEYFKQVSHQWYKSVEQLIDLLSNNFSLNCLVGEIDIKLNHHLSSIEKFLSEFKFKKVEQHANKVWGMTVGVENFIENEINNSTDAIIKIQLNEARQNLDSSKLQDVINSYRVNPDDKQNQQLILSEAHNVKKSISIAKKLLVPFEVKNKFIEARLMEFKPIEKVKEQIVQKMTTEEQKILMSTSSSNRIAIAAIDLHKEASKWDSTSNDLIATAKKMALLFAMISKFVDETDDTKAPPSKKELIDVAKQIVDTALDVVKHSNKIAFECSNRRNKANLVTSIEKIPTVATQLKILATVKATLFGRKNDKEDIEATRILISCAENLMDGVKSVVKDAEAASVKAKDSNWKRL